MNVAGVLRVAAAAMLCGVAGLALGQGAPVLSGTYGNLSGSAGDLNGYELTLLPQAGGTYVVLQCAQGSPSVPVLVPVHRMQEVLTFEIQQPNNVCNGTYSATLGADGLALRGPDGRVQVLAQGPSYWVSHGGGVRAATPYESATEPYFKALNAVCPAHGLEHLSQDQLGHQIERFEPQLNAAQEKSYQRAATLRCDGSMVGSGCANVGFLEAAQRDGFLGKFVQFVCGQAGK